MTPDEQHFHEATGNEGASFERTYRRAGLVLWPRARRLAVLNHAGLARHPAVSRRSRRALAGERCGDQLAAAARGRRAFAACAAHLAARRRGAARTTTMPAGRSICRFASGMRRGSIRFSTNSRPKVTTRRPTTKRSCAPSRSFQRRGPTDLLVRIVKRNAPAASRRLRRPAAALRRRRPRFSRERRAGRHGLDRMPSGRSGGEARGARPLGSPSTR